MTITPYRDLIQGTDEWLQVRAGVLTASVAGQLITSSTLKVAKNDTSRALIAHLVAEQITGYVEENFTSADMERGTMSEPYARDLYSRHMGVEVEEIGFILREEDDLRIGWSPDGLVEDEGAIEIKAPRAKSHVQTMIEDRVPSKYMAQIQTGLFTSDRKWMDFVSYCGGHPLYIQRVYPDPAWQEAIATAARHFKTEAQRLTDAYREAGEGMPVAPRIDFDAPIRLKL